MISFRHMAVAFIEFDGKFLMQKRSKDKTIAGGIYAPVGGHLECDEYQNPVDGCLREINEETGLLADQLKGLKLKYIVLRRKDQEIRLQYVYFMKSITQQVRSNHEGDLEWLSSDELMESQTTYTTHEIFKHFITQSTYEDPVLVASVDSKPSMHFVNIEDFDHPFLP